ncbi:MAG: efflux RND transporter periplasmic adaptor subunit [Patescibacteria group bacterium]|nr:efflux RND transporter periplasmic adaptor subunit [Patescibacteria group bacterium]
MKKITIIISIVVIALGGYFAYQGFFGEKDSSREIVIVSKGEIIQNVSVTGTVIPAKQIDLQLEDWGRIRKIEVEVGDKVVAGQSLVRLNTAELDAQLQSNYAALNVAEAKLAQILAGSREEALQVYQTVVLNAEIDVADKEQALINVQVNAANDLNEAYEDALDEAKIAYTKADQALLITFAEMREEYFNGNDQIDLNVKSEESIAKQSLLSARGYLDAAESDSSYNNIELVLEEIKSALDDIRDALAYLRLAMNDASVKNLVSSTHETSVDTERTTIDTELIALTSAEQKIKSTEISNQTNINTAEANLNTSKATLKKAENELALKEAAPRQTDIDLAEAEVRRARANVAQIQEKINKNILRAPMNGTITALNKEEGEIAVADFAIVSMINSGRFQIEANISETEIARVNLGDKAEMTLDALGPEEKFIGQIIKIDPAETIISGVIYYRVTSVFDAEDARIKPGMTVNLDIQTDRKENILYLPYYLIKGINGQKFVNVLKNGKIVEQIIKTGLEGENRIEIIEGLKEGDEVVLER